MAIKTTNDTIAELENELSFAKTLLGTVTDVGNLMLDELATLTRERDGAIDYAESLELALAETEDNMDALQREVEDLRIENAKLYAPKAAKRGFEPGDRIYHTGYSGDDGNQVFTLAHKNGSVWITTTGQIFGYEWDFRHVYDINHEPPEGVNVLVDVFDDDADMRFLVRNGEGWSWEYSPKIVEDYHHPWNAVSIVAGLLVEYRDGDA